jgi:hypothetical protein
MRCHTGQSNLNHADTPGRSPYDVRERSSQYQHSIQQGCHSNQVLGARPRALIARPLRRICPHTGELRT